MLQKAKCGSLLGVYVELVMYAETVMYAYTFSFTYHHLKILQRCFINVWMVIFSGINNA